MSSALALSALLARMSREELLSAVRSRRVSNPASISDPLGLAIEYLRPDSISRALSHLDLRALRALSSADFPEAPTDTVQVLRARALVGWDERTNTLVPLPEITKAAKEALAGLTPADPPIPREPQDSAISGWYGQGVAAVRMATALLQVLHEEPAKMNRKGVVTVTALRTLADRLRTDTNLVAALLSAVEWAGLATSVTESDRPSAPTRLALTSEADPWRETPYPDRWLRLANGLTESVTSEVRQALSSNPEDFAAATGPGLEALFPLLPSPAREHAARLHHTAEALGATSDGWCTPAFTAFLRGDRDAARHIANHDFPAAAEGIYLQPDLTLVAPGPLESLTEQTLFTLAEIDQLGAAAVLRITQRSLERSLRRGLTTDSIREFLSAISLTGIPQPLDFMLNDLQRERPTPPQSASLAHHWVARQVAPGNTPIGATAVEVSPTDTETKTADANQMAVIERVFEAAHLAPGGGDLGRLLELAIRDRNSVQVTAVAGADQRTFTLMPLAVTGGRLRATDQVAGVERTLPLTAITAVIPA